MRATAPEGTDTDAQDEPTLLPHHEVPDSGLESWRPIIEYLITEEGHSYEHPEELKQAALELGKMLQERAKSRLAEDAQLKGKLLQELADKVVPYAEAQKRWKMQQQSDWGAYSESKAEPHDRHKFYKAGPMVFIQEPRGVCILEQIPLPL